MKSSETGLTPCLKRLLQACLKFDNKTIGQVPAWHSIQPFNQHPWLQQAFMFTWMTCMSEKEWGVEDLIKRHLPLPDLSCRDRYREATGPSSSSSFPLSPSILFPWTLWDAWVTALCGVLWVCVLCDACVLCNCSAKHPWWQSDRHAFSHSTLALFIVPRRDATPGLSLRKCLMIPVLWYWSYTD